MADPISTPPEPGAVQQVIAERCTRLDTWFDRNAGFQTYQAGTRELCERAFEAGKLAALSVPSGGAPTTKAQEEEATRMDSQCDPGTSRTAPTVAPSSDEIPRRVRWERLTPAERAIFAAVEAVEALPADVRLTDAVVLLQAARMKVADYVDGV